MFSIDQEWWAGLARSLPTDFGDPVILPSLIQGSPHFEALMQLFETLLTEPSRLERESLIHETFSEFLMDHASHHGPVAPPKEPVQAVQTARSLLAERYSEAISLDELALASGLSAYHLLRVFKEQVGLPPHAYQNQCRINAARKLLAHGLPIARVAQETGFSDQSHLNRNFKQAVGATPRQYQQARRFAAE
ncbi:MAG: AraC family transcriptional regulator [Desulfovibrio sp.]|nr:MAG: AraC family transcriptional regulator [Desulfovibrio sp.]